MRPFLLRQLAILASGPFLLSTRTHAFQCEAPTNGCTNGLFSVSDCKCQCIPPFCTDSNGDCTIPGGNCSGNPWEECTRGEDCPWWIKITRDGCTTGPSVPAGMWLVYNTRQSCCDTNYPDDANCNPDAIPAVAAPPPAAATTETPPDATADAVEIIVDEEEEGNDEKEKLYEIVPIKLDIGELPNDFIMRDLKEEAKELLTRIMGFVSERIEGLNLSNIEEDGDDVGSRRSLRRVLLQKQDVSLLRHSDRRLERDVSLYYVINVAKDGDKAFGPMIINEIRTSVQELQMPASPSASNYLMKDDINLNICTAKNGRYSDCAPVFGSPTNLDSKDTNPGTSTNSQQPGAIVYPEDDNQGLAGWAIFLIVASVLIVLCCVGYAIWWFCFAEPYDYNDENKSRVSNWEDDYSKRFDDKSRASRGGSYTSRRSRRSTATRDNKHTASVRSLQSKQRTDSGAGVVDIVLAQPQDPKFDEDSFSINTYGTRKTKQIKQITNGGGKDPTQYLPGRGAEERLDPEDGTDRDDRSVAGGRKKRSPKGTARKYRASTDPSFAPNKPRRDPTMYVDGQSCHGKYYKNTNNDEGHNENRRDPTMYTQGIGDDPTAALVHYKGKKGDAPSSSGNHPPQDDPSATGAAENSVYESYEWDESKSEKYPAAGNRDGRSSSPDYDPPRNDHDDAENSLAFDDIKSRVESIS